ncbi:MAG: protein BatD [Methylococcaceae bacterium]|nr:protein BatD [Methylococcaceae bacterium]
MLPVFVLMTFAGQTFAVQISVSVDRNPVSMDESFKILFTANESPDGDPDFSPLEHDFDIINQSQSSNMSVVNGSFTKSVRWTVEVTAKKPGKLEIPAIQFGNDTSEPLPIVVSQGSADSGDDSAHPNEDIYLDVKAEPENPYVQSQVLYTIRFYSRVSIAQAELSEPELADAVIEKLGEDSNFNTVVNGVSYHVIERKYAIFPQKSGALTIKPLTLNAQMIVASQPDFSDFFGSRMTKTKRVLSKEVVLNVKPAPPEFKGKEWLAAEILELTQEWSGDTQQMKAGEPLTRTLTLRGVGTTVGQLPELNIVKTDAAIKTYPDKPVLNEQKNPEGITATRQEKIAFIPATAGKHSLPAIEIPWFNIKTHKMEIALIPETVINVVGDTGKMQETPPAKPLSESSKSAVNAETTVTKPEAASHAKSQENIWSWVSLGLALGWLTTVVYFVLDRRRDRQSKTVTQNRIHNDLEHELKHSGNKLKDACAKDNPHAAKEALLAWGKQKFNAVNLGTLAEHCDARLRDEILSLNQCLYAKDKHIWTGKKLYQAFSENNAMKKTPRQEQHVLEPLHRI